LSVNLLLHTRQRKRWCCIINSEMELLTKVLIGFVALIHCYILWLEMFAWETRGRKVFKNVPRELFAQTKAFAANQGLYNGFLAAGLVWSLFIQEHDWHVNVALFFLICVFVAGIYGAISIDRKIFFVQSLPAMISIIAILLQ
jgi:putative membrane protein